MGLVYLTISLPAEISSYRNYPDEVTFEDLFIVQQVCLTERREGP